MKNNMENFQKKIEEMQRKLNIINEDIEEIKNERKSYDKNIKIDKANTFLNCNYKRKNFLEDDINNNINNNSTNFVRRNNLINYKNNSNLNNTGRINFPMKNEKHSLIDNNIEEIPKKYYTVSREINKNMLNIDYNEINKKKDLTINYIDNYNKKNTNEIIKKYKSSFNTINSNDENKLNIQYGNINNKKNDEYVYKNNSLYQNYCHMKKNLNDININSNNFNNSQSINSNTNKGNKTLKNKNSFSSLQCRKKTRRIKEGNIKNFSKTNKNYFNNEFSTNNKNLIYNNNKTIDINYNYSYNRKNIFNNNENTKSNGPIKIKARNGNTINNKSENIKIIEKNNTVEDINLKNKRSLSIQNPKLEKNINHSHKHNKNLKLQSINTFKPDEKLLYSNYQNNQIKTENLGNNKNDKNKNNYKRLLDDIIDITNKYNNSDNKVNMNNIIDEYKLLLYDIKIKNEFIYKIINLYNINTNSNLKDKDNESLIQTWNWILDSQKKLMDKNENEDKQYKKLCKEIMDEYNLKSIDELKAFIHKLCKKIEKNENFLEGIKKILLP